LVYDLAEAAIHMVATTRPATKPRVVDLGHLLERFRARLILLLHSEVVRAA
jgi:hypothetical protein